MMWGSAWKTDRVNAQPHLRASRRVRTLGDVDIAARRQVTDLAPLAAEIKDRIGCDSVTAVETAGAGGSVGTVAFQVVRFW
jgi:hypothetical protein